MKIFLSYRRDDTAGQAGRLADRLCARFGRDAVFRDLDSIAPGRDFAVAIEEAVGASDALLAVIGRRWLSASTGDGSRRLDDPGDYVRVEIATALARGIRVIPLLVDGAVMPDGASLPAPLASLARRNALEVSESRWDYDVQRLTNALDPESPETLSGPVPVVTAGPERRRWIAAAGSAAAVLIVGTLTVLAGGGGGGGRVEARATTTGVVLPSTTSPAVSEVSTTSAAPSTATTAVPPRPTQPSTTRVAPPEPTTPTTVSPPPPSPTPPPPPAPSTTVAPLRADAVAGKWSGTVSDGSGGTFLIVLDVRTGCGLAEKCGSIFVSNNNCRGDFTFLDYTGGTYEFYVSNFASGSGSNCFEGGGEFLTPSGANLKYSTNYGPSGVLVRS